MKLSIPPNQPKHITKNRWCSRKDKVSHSKHIFCGERLYLPTGPQAAKITKIFGFVSPDQLICITTIPKELN